MCRVLIAFVVLTFILSWKMRVCRNSDGDLLLSGGRFKVIVNMLVTTFFSVEGSIYQNRISQCRIGKKKIHSVEDGVLKLVCICCLVFRHTVSNKEFSDST